MRIVITTKTFHPEGHRLLVERDAEVRVIDQYDPPAALEATMAEFDPVGLISRTMLVTARAIDAAPSLRVIAKTGIGYDNVDIDAATRRSIPVLFSFGANAASVAEHALALMFAIARNVARHDALMHAGQWSRFNFIAHELEGRRLGLVGFGASAQQLAKKAEGIGMQVAVYAPRYRFEKPGPSITVEGSLEDLCAHSDILSLHCPLTEQTLGMITPHLIAVMPEGAWIINTSRGPLINEVAMMEALRSGHLGAAGLDTYVDEPLDAAHPLRSLDNVVLTPHVAGSTLQAAARAHPMTARHILDFLDGRPINERAIANPEALLALAQPYREVPARGP